MTPTGNMLRRMIEGTLFWPTAALIVVVLFNVFFTEGFAYVEWRNGRLYGSLIDILNRGSPVMLLALGMTLVIATGGVDLSVGAIMALSGAVAAALIARPSSSVLASFPGGSSVVLAMAVALAAALLAGLWNGLLVAVLDVQPFVATLILMVAGRGVAQLLTDGQIITVNDPAFAFLGNGSLAGLPFTVIVVATLTLLTGLLTRGTALGLFVEAVGNNPTASTYAGIDTARVKLAVYVFCGLCAGIAGLVAASTINAADVNNAGLYLELDAILAVVIGGTPLTGGRIHLLGSLIGALLIQAVTTTILTRGIGVEYTLVLKAAVIVGVCLLQSETFRQSLARHFRGRAL
jgi:galactofuranose transport system permease protein